MDGTASYKKLRDGGWGIRTLGYVPDVGDTVDVTQKSGEVKSEEVSKIIWSGSDDSGGQVSICEIVATDRDGNRVASKPKAQQQGGGQGRPAGGGQSRPQCKCHGCGTTDPSKEYYCSDCVSVGDSGVVRGGQGKATKPSDDSDEIPF